MRPFALSTVTTCCCCCFFAVIACCSCNITMRSRICFWFAVFVIYFLPSNAGFFGNALTTGYRGNGVAANSPRVPGVPFFWFQLGAHRSRKHPQTFRDASAGAEINFVKRKTFWKGNQGGPLPVDEILGRHNDGQLTDLGPSHKAMRYG